MKNKVLPNVTLMILVIAASVASASCNSIKVPATTVSPIPLEEKSLPPVFSNMNLLWSRYFFTLHFTNTYSSLVFSFHPHVLETEFAELTLNSNLTAVPDKLIAYKVIRPVVDEKYARSLAKRLGFNDPPVFYSTDNTYRVYNGSPSDDNSPVFSIYEDGSIAIYYTRNQQKPLSLPSDQECIEIARKWINSYNLYPKGVISIEASPSILYMMQGRTESHYTYATSVSFLMGLDGYELFGMGAYFAIGENGKVLEVHINAPEFEPYSYVKVQKPDLALSTLQDYLHNPSKFWADTPDCLIRNLYRYISVNNVSLKYFSMLSPDDTQTVYAQPIYVLEGEGRDKPELSWEHLTGAVDAVLRY